jgi:hypothetical protein
MDVFQELQNLIDAVFYSFDNLLKSIPYPYVLLFVGIFPLFVLALALYFFEKKRSLEKEVLILRKKFETYTSIFNKKCEEVLTEKRNEIEDLIHEEVIPKSIEIFVKSDFFKSIAPNFDESQINEKKIKEELGKNVEYLEFTKDLDELLTNIKNETMEEIKKL